MKGSVHLASGAALAVTAAVLTPSAPWIGLLAVAGAMLPDFAHAAAAAMGKPFPNLLPSFMPYYRAGHSLLLWVPLTLLTWGLHPALPWLFAGVAAHLLLDWPTHQGNRPLWPLPFKFDGLA